MHRDGTWQHLQLRHLIEKVDQSRDRPTGGDDIIKDDDPPGGMSYQKVDVPLVKGQKFYPAGNRIGTNLDDRSS